MNHARVVHATCTKHVPNVNTFRAIVVRLQRLPWIIFFFLLIFVVVAEIQINQLGVLFFFAFYSANRIAIFQARLFRYVCSLHNIITAHSIAYIASGIFCEIVSKSNWFVVYWREEGLDVRTCRDWLRLLVGCRLNAAAAAGGALGPSRGMLAHLNMLFISTV